MFKPCCRVALVCVTLSGTAVADILHVPGDYRTIQAGIDAAVDGDEVVVADGIYTGDGNRDLDFGGKLITVRSANGPDNCIIDCQGSEADPHRGFYFHSGETKDALVEGFTITNGVVTGTSPGGKFGGGMYNSSSSPTVTNCTFSGNTALGDGGGMLNFDNSNPTVTNCTFDSNFAQLRGGGMANRDGSSPTVTSCIFSGNTALPRLGGGGGDGGGMFNDNDSSPTVAHCTFSGNLALAGNGGAMFNGGGGPTVTNCILWGDSPNEISGAAATVRYSDVAGGFAGIGNIDADPLFVDEANGNLRLMTGSPCADAGKNWGVPIDADDYDQDGNTAELFPVDLDGNPRFNADEADFDPGCGVPVVVDMGAYEYQFAPVEEVIFADLNADGVVGILDLLGVLAAWGDAKNNCLADLDIDGDVGILDLLTLLSNWG